MDRRTLLAQGALAALTLGAPAGRAQTVPCADPATLTASQRSRRRSLGYAEPAGDAAKRCGACAFFAGAVTGCGTCQLLSGAPVSATGGCASFAAKG